MRITVTIARQLGCGGSIVGQELAQKLNVRCIDREIISETARKFELDEEEVEAREEKISTFWERVLGGMVIVAPEASFVPPSLPKPTDQQIFESETEVMKSIAQEQDCVIVGRAAAHVLPRHTGMVNIYLYAPLSFRVPRVMAYYKVDEARATELVKRSDEMRSKYIAQMTTCDANDARRYHLSLDTSTLPFDEITDMVVGFVQRKIDAGG